MSYYGCGRLRALGAASGLAALTMLLLQGTAFAGQAEILWDQFAIPHIYGRDLLTVVRGLGYAEMENHAETILLNTAAARGRSAEYFGPGSNNANVNNDIAVHTEGIPERSLIWLLTGGSGQAAIISAFTAGANEYAARHGDTINSAFKRVLPLVPTDVTAGIQNTVHFHIMPSQDNIPALISAWQSGGINAANALACSFTPGCTSSNASPAVAAKITHGGSNGWAIAPSKSASGNAILMGNPHLPWGNNVPLPPSDGLGLFQWMEANLVIGDSANPQLNASGVVLPGAPFLGIGFSDKVGWTHTNNTIQNTNLYELTLNPDGITYNFGGVPLPLLCKPDSIKILQSNGSFVSQNFETCASVHGPIVAQNGNKLLALRVAGLDQPSMVTQYWGMIQANNLQEFMQANSALQMPFFNVIYAGQDGNIFYLFGGRQPVRNGGSWGDYSGILDGSNSSLLWTSTFAFSQLPHAIDPPGGFVANSNNPPWTSTIPSTATNDFAKFLAKAEAYVSPQFMDLRPQNGASFLQSNNSLSVAQVLTGKESTRMLLADRVLPDLISAASGNPAAQAAVTVLSAWDRTSDSASVGAVLFEAWWALLTGQAPANQCALSLPPVALDNTINFYSPHPQFRVAWDPNFPLTTPNGLANPAATVNYLICADTLVQKAYAASGGRNVPWGA
ncbi:MAG: penicillin acylase family protein, partial [Methylocapsa sp.]|nr:penicillin acylase family protein [Methylocapsa sp.]